MSHCSSAALWLLANKIHFRHLNVVLEGVSQGFLVADMTLLAIVHPDSVILC